MITVSVLVAAGIAAYENPQIKQWVHLSRRKLAVALHSLGDGISPPGRHGAQRGDISMTEDLGPEAAQRRDRAREEISLRRSILQENRNKRSGTGSFDALVDSDGRLKEPESIEQVIKEADPVATGVEVSDSSQLPVQRQTQADGAGSLSRSMSEIAPMIDPAQRRAILESIDRDRLLNTGIGSETPSNHPSESLVDLTPTSEHPGTDFDGSILQDFHSFRSNTPSSHTEDGETDFYYAYPNRPEASEQQQDGNSPAQQASSAPSIASSLSHIQHDPFDTSSIGSISDLGNMRDGIYTPASWSEVGSVISNDGDHH